MHVSRGTGLTQRNCTCSEMSYFLCGWSNAFGSASLGICSCVLMIRWGDLNVKSHTCDSWSQAHGTPNDQSQAHSSVEIFSTVHIILRGLKGDFEDVMPMTTLVQPQSSSIAIQKPASGQNFRSLIQIGFRIISRNATIQSLVNQSLQSFRAT